MIPIKLFLVSVTKKLDHLRERRGGLFPKGEHLHAGLQGRAADHHHVLAGAGGIPLHFRKRDMGKAEAVRGRQGQPGLQFFPRIPERRGRADGDRAGGGGYGAPHLPDVHAGADALRHRKIPHGQGHPDAHGEGDVAAQDGGEHPLQRKVQRRRPLAEMLHGGFSVQETQGERRGSAAVLCGRQPRRHHRACGMAARAVGDTAAEEPGAEP